MTTCNGNCARCCCCGSKQLREMPGYWEDITNPSRAEKATIRWNFDGELFDGVFFDLVRVNPPFTDGAVGTTDRVCMVEYRLGDEYYGGYGSSPICVGPWKSTPWVRSAYGKCCPNPAVGPNRAYAIFYRLSARICDIALTVARCKKTTEACTYVNTNDADDLCGYLVNARMKLKLVIEEAVWERGSMIDPIECEGVDYPTAEEVPETLTGFWSLNVVSDDYYPVARSRVVSNLRTIPTEIEIFLPYGINQKECCTEWGVPEVFTPKPSGFNDNYLQCLANPGNFNVKIEPSCRYDNYAGCLNPPCCPNGYECWTSQYDQTINLGDWRFIGTGEPA